MTNETEAPERIWVYPDVNDHFNPAKDDWSSGHWDTEKDASTSGGRPYVLADLSEAQAARIAELEAAIKRQAGAAKTLRNSTLAEVQHIKDNERKQYLAIKTLDSEREANAILTEENEALQARIAELGAEIVRMKSERMYVIGFNDGYDKAENLATLADLQKPIATRDDSA